MTALERIHPDLSKAVVILSGRQEGARVQDAAELLRFGRSAVITVRQTPSLEKHMGVQLVPLPDGRALIALDQPRTLAELELSITDALDSDALDDDDRAVFGQIAGILKEARTADDVLLVRRNIIVLEQAPRKRSSPPTQSRPRSRKAK